MPKLLSSTGARLFLGVWLVYSVCPPFTSYDSYWAVPTALAILQHGSTRVDQYVPNAPAVSHYALDCIPEHGGAIPYDGCSGGHAYNFYPIGVPVIALPSVLFFKLATGLVARLFPNAHTLTANPIVSAFLAGDLAGGHSLVELWTASTLGAITVWLQFQILRRFLSERTALLLALLFAFGTSEWSIASRNLFQHGPSILCLSAALYLLLDERRIEYASLPLAMAFIVRPSNCIPVALITLFVLVRHRRRLVRFLLWSLVVAIPFFADNLVERHALLPRYYHQNSAGRMEPISGFFLNLVSPSRGVLIFTPIVLVSIAGMAIAWRRRRCFPLAPYLMACVALHAVFIAFYWTGHSYGPRYFTDITYLFVFFQIPAVLYWQKMSGRPRAAAAAIFLVLAGWGVFTHARGATSLAANQWSQFPVNVDEARWRVWDWRDPQFLRGLR